MFDLFIGRKIDCPFCHNKFHNKRCGCETIQYKLARKSWDKSTNRMKFYAFILKIIKPIVKPIRRKFCY